MKITPQTKINDLLNRYPELELFLMNLNPKYKKLKNPILRRTVAKIATLTQVAAIGGYDTIKLVNMLRAEVGQESMGEVSKPTPQEQKAVPKWISDTPALEIDANTLLNADKNPLSETSKALKSLKAGEHLLVKSDFLPSPLIDTFEKQGYDIYIEEIDENHFRTLIRRT